ncbi:MAG: DUF1949 domain-containing protein [Methylococcaceae bacterium]|nr:DUF1949 domain-containing protein [Methylococcaceae bacterium]
MYCVKSAHTIEDTIKKSRFIGVIVPCESENAALTALKELYQQHPNANHIAFAYRVQSEKGLICRFHDAGEPTGTAGKPIFKHLEGKQLINLLVAVVRYFGGVKLGAGGLTRAYGNTASKAIEAASIIPYVEYATVDLCLDYKQMQLLEYQLKKLGGKIIKQDFAEKIRLSISLPEKNLKTLTELFKAR